MALFEEAFPGKGVLGSLEDNDEDGDEGEDVTADALGDLSDLNLGALAL